MATIAGVWLGIASSNKDKPGNGDSTGPGVSQSTGDSTGNNGGDNPSPDNPDGTVQKADRSKYSLLKIVLGYAQIPTYDLIVGYDDPESDYHKAVDKLFEGYMHDHLRDFSDFDEFYEGFQRLLREKQNGQMAGINAYWNERAKTCFAPIRTLFIDDCIDNEKGWLQGGARYTYSVHSDSGIPNTVDSLLAIRHLVYEEKRYTADEFLSLLSKEDEAFFRELRACPAYGVGDERSDALVEDFTSRFYAHYLTGKLDLGIGFFPTAHQFRRHVGFGKCVGPTPDGRHAGEPEADSLAAVNGKATEGPTRMLASAARFVQKDVYGMAVTNLSLSRKHDPSVVRALVEGYFALGGTQLQITVADRETLLDAKVHPDAHRDLIVRVGGYSEYFCKLDPEIQNAVIARTLFEA